MNDRLCYSGARTRYATIVALAFLLCFGTACGGAGAVLAPVLEPAAIPVRAFPAVLFAHGERPGEKALATALARHLRRVSSTATWVVPVAVLADRWAEGRYPRDAAVLEVNLQTGLGPTPEHGEILCDSLGCQPAPTAGAGLGLREAQYALLTVTLRAPPEFAVQQRLALRAVAPLVFARCVGGATPDRPLDGLDLACRPAFPDPQTVVQSTLGPSMTLVRHLALRLQGAFDARRRLASLDFLVLEADDAELRRAAAARAFDRAADGYGALASSLRDRERARALHNQAACLMLAEEGGSPPRLRVAEGLVAAALRAAREAGLAVAPFVRLQRQVLAQLRAAEQLHVQRVAAARNFADAAAARNDSGESPDDSGH